uniref:Pink-eyed dilution-like 1 n=1 Tax=Savillea parva TaxID=1909275 RepID=A0A1D8RAI3_9EUKA|nr:pink-eyed dilution-like 1 [Savillea parva]|eukprot:m.79955 g.79955  ORF g.79955 m.79955 type:complete len:1170 (+) comp9316_c0_seq1:251-3760(+)
MSTGVPRDVLRAAENGEAGRLLGDRYEDSDDNLPNGTGEKARRSMSYSGAMNNNGGHTLAILGGGGLAGLPEVEEESEGDDDDDADAPTQPRVTETSLINTEPLSDMAHTLAKAHAAAAVCDTDAASDLLDVAVVKAAEESRRLTAQAMKEHGHGMALSSRATSASAPGSTSDLSRIGLTPSSLGGSHTTPVSVRGSLSNLKQPGRTKSLQSRRSVACTSQSFYNEMADLIPELRQHRFAALHESRTTIGRCMSSHTKAVLTMITPPAGESSTDPADHPPRLMRWRSLEDIDIRTDKRPMDGGDPVDVHTNKRRGTMAAEAAFHPRGTQSDHEASSSESEAGKSSDEEEDEILERMLEKNMHEHGLSISPTQRPGQAAKLRKQHHRSRHYSEAVDVEEGDDEGDHDEKSPDGVPVRRMRGPAGAYTADNDEANNIKAQKNIHIVLSSMRRSISELILIADSLDVRVRSSAQHLRKCSYNLLESMVSVKQHIYEHIHMQKYRAAQEDGGTRGRSMLAELRLQHAGRSRFFVSQQAGSPRRRGISAGSDHSGGDTISLTDTLSEKFPVATSMVQRFGVSAALAVLGLVILIILFLASGNQPHVPFDPLAHTYFASHDRNGTIDLNPDEPFDWVELHVQLPDIENNHYGHVRETVTFELESRAKGTSDPFVSTGHGRERCRQAAAGGRQCFFEGFTNLDTNRDYHFAFRLLNSSSYDDHGGIPIEAEAIQMGPIGFAKLWLCAIILLGSLIIIAKEWIHRTLVAFVGSMLVLGLLLWCNMFPTLGTVMEWIDEETLGLLFGMMIIVGRLAETGFFQVATARVLPFSKGSTFRLVIILCVLTGILSAFLDNVTTMILLAPITIEMMQALQLDPVPFLIAETLFSNVGGAATQIGDPPNIIIGSAYPEISFVDFLSNMLPGIVLMYAPLLVFLRWQYKTELTGRLVHFNDGLEVARQYVITDWPLLQKTLVVLSFVLLTFVTHSVHHVNPAWAATMGAIALMLASNPHEIDHALEAVEWDVLLFFAALFVMVEGVAELGFIRFIGGIFQAAIEPANEEDRTIVAITLLIWISAIVSAFLDNIPYTATMIPVIAQLADEDDGLGLDLVTLAWALAFGACLGGNGSLIGASANIVVSSIAHRYGHQMSFSKFFKVSFPFMIVSIIMAHAYMLARYG